jgi:hypothetical protein
MKKLVMSGIIPLFAGVMLYATEPQHTTMNSGYNGSLMSVGCVFHRNQINQMRNGYLDVSVVMTTDCPVKQTSSAIGVIAPNGKFVPLAPATNKHLITRGRRRHNWNTVIAQNKPVNVRVIPTPNGSVVVRPIQPTQ